MSSANEQFFQRWAEEFDGSTEWYDDDQRTDVMALVVLGDVPIDVSRLDFGHNVDGTYQSIPDHKHSSSRKH
jgi:hypothetical protein